MKINTNRQEIEYKNLYFPFRAVRRKIQSLIPKAVLDRDFKEFCVHKTFNKVTGEIDRKFAWDSIFQSLHDQGVLEVILDAIIEDEYLT